MRVMDDGSGVDGVGLTVETACSAEQDLKVAHNRSAAGHDDRYC